MKLISLKIYLILTILINYSFSFDCNFFPILKKLYNKNKVHDKYNKYYYTRGDAKKNNYNKVNLLIQNTTTDFIKVSNKNNYNFNLKNIQNNITNVSKSTLDFTKFLTLK